MGTSPWSSKLQQRFFKNEHLVLHLELATFSYWQIVHWEELEKIPHGIYECNPLGVTPPHL